MPTKLRSVSTADKGKGEQYQDELPVVHTGTIGSPANKERISLGKEGRDDDDVACERTREVASRFGG